MSEKKKYYYIVAPTGEVIVNVLEVTELWAWAVFGKFKAPSNIPRCYIQSREDQGYQCFSVELKQRLGTQLSNSNPDLKDK